MAHLRIEIAGATFVADLPRGIVRIGRDPECDLVIDDPAVSSVHASVEPMASGGHLLKDENSGRVTKVNGMGVKRVSLREGDVVEIGPARLTYLLAAVAPAPAPAPVAAPPRAAPAAAVPAVAAVAVPPATAPAVAVAKTAPVAAAAPAASVTVAAPSTAAPAVLTRTAPTPRPSEGKRKLTAALAAVGLFAGLAVIGAQILSSGGDGAQRIERRKADLDRGTRLAQEGDVEAALAIFEDLTKCEVPGVRVKAGQEAEYWRAMLKRAESDYADLLARAPTFDDAAAKSAVESLALKHGEAFAKRQGDVLAKVVKARDASVEARAAETASEADAWVERGNFTAAAAAWDAFEKDAPPVEAARAALEAARASLAERTASAFASLLSVAETRAQADGPGAAATLLRNRLADFAGTEAGQAIARKAREYDERVFPAATTTSQPGQAVPTGTGPGPAPTPTGPSAPANAAAYQAAVARVETALLSRKIPEAVAAGEEAVKAAGSGPLAATARTLLDDLNLARQGMEMIGKAIREHSDRFTDFEISARFSVRLVNADAEFLTALVPGGQAKHRWSALDASRFARLVDLARFSGKEVLPAAQLLAAVGAREGAERALFRHVEDGGDKAAAFARLARWRHEKQPPGGYVAFEGRFVTPVERDKLVLEARIAQAVARVSAKDAAGRKAACDELLSLGAPGKAALAKALKSRRAALVSELSGLKVWTSGKTRQRLQTELEKRRKEAIALIENEAAYPYPSPTHQGQPEVNRLVDRVREVWERPFDVVVGGEKGAAGDKSAQELLVLVAEADTFLAQAEDGYTPDLDGLKTQVNKAIDVPGISPDSYSRDVLAYNERIPTSATREEKDNVRAVNEYRIMMGRSAVKINERLVRAARGHSIEMRTKGYFAHESPTPGLESPGKRAAREGYSGGVGENIATGTTTGRDAFSAWFHSSGHHRNMLNRGWTEMGAGRSGLSMWTQKFGAMGGKNLKDPEALPPPRADVAPEPEDASGGPAAPGRPSVPDEPPPTAPPDENPPDDGMPPGDPPPDGGGMDDGSMGGG